MRDELRDIEREMTEAIDALKERFKTLRTGRANLAILDGVRVTAYGAEVPLNQVSNLSVPDPTLIVAQPWDPKMAPEIERAIRKSDLGLNPQSSGNLLRIPLPALSEERRKDLVKLVHKLAEEGRVAVRHGRTEALHKIKKVEHVSEDEKTRAEKEVQKAHDEHMKQIDGLIHSKEAEIMEV